MSPLIEPIEEEAKPPKSARESAMEEMIAKRRAQIDRERDEAYGTEPDQIEELDRQAGQPRARDERGRFVKEDEAPTEEVAPKKTFKLKVQGREEEIDEEEAIRILQKEKAGDHRIREAQNFEERLRAYHLQLDQYRENLKRGLDEKGQPVRPSPGTPEPSTGKQPSATDARGPSDEELKSRAKELQATLYSGEPDKVQDALYRLLSDVAQGRQSATPPSVDVETVVAKAAERAQAALAERAREADRIAANDVFRNEYQQIDQDPVLMAAARAHYQKLQAESTNKSLTDLARQTGKDISERFKLAKPAPDPQVDQLAERRELKARRVLPQAPSAAASVRDPSPAPKRLESGNSGADYIKWLNNARGKPTT
jgi:hypothetical protein